MFLRVVDHERALCEINVFHITKVRKTLSNEIEILTLDTWSTRLHVDGDYSLEDIMAEIKRLREKGE